MAKALGPNTTIIPGKPPKSIPHKDHYCRVTYLHQASTLMGRVPAGKLHHSQLQGSKSKSRRLKGKYDVLSRVYSRGMDLVAKKVVLKTTPLLKRTGCKQCHRRLVVGITASMSMENNSRARLPQSDVLCLTCVGCGTVKRFPVGKDRSYEVFSERPEVAISVN